jgi:Trk K+ transport system NAD-binding subunit
MSELLVKKLDSKGISYAIVDRDITKVENLVNLGVSAIYGNFADEKILAGASFDRAEYVIFATEKDYENLLGIITVHHLNDRIKIFSRARDQQAVPKMHRAGAALCVVPEILAGLDIGSKIVSKMV